MSYAEYKYGCQALEGRDMMGRWIEFVTKAYYEKQKEIK